MDYFRKLDTNPAPDLAWNLPETKKGTIKVIGGNSQSFRTEIKVSEYLTANSPIETISTVLPDSLKFQLPDLPNFIFIGSTDSGSFADEVTLSATMATTDYNLLLGDLSKNTITAQIFANILKTLTCPTLITRDAVDLVAATNPEQILLNDQLIFFASMPSLQKLFRAVYYPKMLLLSQSLVQVADALHKFTLSYPAKIVTLHSGQILIAESGEVCAIPLEKSGHTTINFWQGELAAKITVFNLYNPHNFLDATSCALFA